MKIVSLLRKLFERGCGSGRNSRHCAHRTGPRKFLIRRPSCQGEPDVLITDNSCCKCGAALRLRGASEIGLWWEAVNGEEVKKKGRGDEQAKQSVS